MTKAILNRLLLRTNNALKIHRKLGRILRESSKGAGQRRTFCKQVMKARCMRYSPTTFGTVHLILKRANVLCTSLSRTTLLLRLSKWKTAKVTLLISQVHQRQTKTTTRGLTRMDPFLSKSRSQNKKANSRLKAETSIQVCRTMSVKFLILQKIPAQTPE